MLENREKYEILKKWAEKLNYPYGTFESFQKRKNKISLASNTKIDNLLENQLKIFFTDIPIEKVIEILRISQSLQTLNGTILEFFIEVKLSMDNQWFHSNDCLRGCDFIHPIYPPVQIKNKSNTENSSSCKVRENKEIIKWHRLHARNGNTYWMELNDIFHLKLFTSEEEAEKEYLNFSLLYTSLIKDNRKESLKIKNKEENKIKNKEENKIKNKEENEIKNKDINEKEMNPLFINKSVWSKFSEDEMKKYVDDVFNYYRKNGFPYFSTDINFLKDELRKCENYDFRKCVDEENKLIKQSMHGLSLSWSYHPHHYEVKCNNLKTPYEVFHNDDLFRKVIEKRIKMGDNISDNGIRKMIKVFTGTQAVSNFRPTAAAAIYHRFSENGSTVLDMSFGFGGRVLGAFLAKRKYIGFDPSTKTYEGVKRMCDFLKGQDTNFNPTLYHKGSEIPFTKENGINIPEESIDLCFTSPPYFNTEKYSDEPTQSYIKFQSKNEWINGFLGGTFENCYKVLKKGKYMLINIQNVKSFPNLVEETKRIAIEKGFEYKDEWGLHLSSLKNGGFKTEPILIFIK